MAGRHTTPNSFSWDRRREGSRADRVPSPPVHGSTFHLSPTSLKPPELEELGNGPFLLSTSCRKGGWAKRWVFGNVGTRGVTRVDHKNESRHLAFSKKDPKNKQTKKPDHLYRRRPCILRPGGVWMWGQAPSRVHLVWGLSTVMTEQSYTLDPRDQLIS